MSGVQEALFTSPTLLGLCVLVACAVASTSTLYFCRPQRGPGYWAACCWLLVVSYALFFVGKLYPAHAQQWPTNLLLVLSQTLMMLGIFRFLGRAVPFWLVPLTVLAQLSVEYFAAQRTIEASVRDAGYCLIVILLTVMVGLTLSRDRQPQEIQAVRLFILASLIAYGMAHLLRLGLALGSSYTWLFTEDSTALLSFYTGLPFLIIALVALTAMSLHRTLAQSRRHELQARENLRRFEQLMGISSAATVLLHYGEIEDSNTKLGELFGCRTEALRGASFATLFVHADDPAPLDGQPYHRTAVRADQKTFQAEITQVMLDDEHALAEIRDVSRQKKLESQLASLANLDPLTGALNRRAFAAQFDQAQRLQVPMCLATLDLDHFKQVNDRFGHAIGDRVLVEFAKVCRHHARQGDVFARFGGEEFVFLLIGCTQQDARMFLERLLEVLRDTHVDGLPSGWVVEFSAGLANSPCDAPLDIVLNQSDRALYLAKANGRGRVESVE